MPDSPWCCCELTLPLLAQATIVVGCWDNRIYGYHAASGDPRWEGNVGSPVMRVVVIRDVDGDGVDDIGVGSWGSAGRVHSGADGQTIWATPVGDDCWTCDPVDDTNGDGYQELAVGSFNGRVYLMDGVTGEILWSYNVGDKLFTVRGVPDLTFNGIPDVVAGTQRLNYSGGVCYALEGNDDIPVSVADLPRLDFSLDVAPNPCRGNARWSFGLAAPAAHASLELFDPNGRLVRVLHSGPAGRGTTTVHWEGLGAADRRLPAGVYLGRLAADGRTIGTRRLLVLR
jgi:outer membrane protein assembly factor BamB